MNYMRPFPCSVGLGLLFGLTTLVALEGSAGAVPAYLDSVGGGQPWGQNTNEQAMDMVFGAGGWDALDYDTVDPMVLFGGTYEFLYIDGSDSGAIELLTFMMANQAELEAWVSAGGVLFLNSAPNEGGNQAWGFGGITLDYPGNAINPGSASDPMHPIWNGPNLPAATMFTGDGYAHATVSGPGLLPLIEDAGGAVNLAEMPFGGGLVVFGGLTTSNFWDPQPDALNLRANIIAYLGSGDDDMDGIVNPSDNCPQIANPMQEDMDMDGVGDICDDCPMDDQNDADMDMACDSTDNCLGLANPMQIDDDMDGAGNACDECPGDPDDDVDNDTVCGDMDNCPADINVNQADDDMDGIGNVCDVCPDDPGNDPDEDMVCAGVDNCPDDANPGQEDADMNGVGDACDEAGETGADETSGDGSGDGTGDGSSGGGGDVGETGTDPDTGGNGSTGMGGTGSDGTGGGDAGADGGGDSDGCGCQADPQDGRAWWLLGLFGLALRRRRRAA